MVMEREIDSWRHSVPSRLEREDPFANDGFGTRPTTRLTFREPERLPSKFNLRSIFKPKQRPPTAAGARLQEPEKRGVLRFLGRKRKAESPPPLELAAPLHLNFLFVGGTSVGQTSLLYRARYGFFPDKDFCNAATTLRNDTSGASDLNSVENLSYITWDAVFLCFDVKDKASMYLIIRWWEHVVANGFIRGQEFSPLLHLVGMKNDLRCGCDEGTGTPSPVLPVFTNPSACCVCPAEAAWQARRMGAHRYFESSALTGKGIEKVIDEAGTEAMRRVIVREQQEVPAGKRRC